MNNANIMPASELFDRATLLKYQLEYERQNPYNLPELRRNRRRLRIVKGHECKLVFSTRLR